MVDVEAAAFLLFCLCPRFFSAKKSIASLEFWNAVWMKKKSHFSGGLHIFTKVLNDSLLFSSSPAACCRVFWLNFSQIGNWCFLSVPRGCFCQPGDGGQKPQFWPPTVSIWHNSRRESNSSCLYYDGSLLAVLLLTIIALLLRELNYDVMIL